MNFSLWNLKKKIHPSWLICVFCLSFLAGVFLSQYVVLDSKYFVIAIIFSVFSFLKRRRYVLFFVVIAALILGDFRGGLGSKDIYELSKRFGDEIELSVRSSESPDLNEKNEISFAGDMIKIDGEDVSGKVWVSTRESNIVRGDQIAIRGIMSEGFGSFSATVREAKVIEIIHGPVSIWQKVSGWFSQGLIKSIGDENAKLGLGFLLGQRKSLDDDLVLALQLVGLTHIVVASGYNLTILVNLCRRIFLRISKYSAMFFSLVLVFSFVSITGLSPSMIRAAIVTVLSLLAWYYGRKFHPLILISFTAAITVLANPFYIWGDVGWYLSFAAFAGIMLVSPVLSNFLFGKEKINVIWKIVIDTVSAMLTTTPILIYFFGYFSNISLLISLLVLPLIPVIMLLTFIAGISGGILPWSLSKILGYPAKMLLELLTNLVKFFSELPWATSKISISILGLLAYYLLLTGFFVFIWSLNKKDERLSSWLESI